MQNIDELNEMISFIEAKTNYYSMFKHVINTCANARCAALELWNVSQISDIELHNYIHKIEMAREEAIITHKNWLKKRLKENERYHTMESIIETIYDVIF